MPLNTWERILCRAQASLEGQTIPNIPISTSWNGQIAEVTYGDEHEVDRGRRMPGMSGSKVVDGRSLVPGGVFIRSPASCTAPSNTAQDARCNRAIRMSYSSQLRAQTGGHFVPDRNTGRALWSLRLHQGRNSGCVWQNNSGDYGEYEQLEAKSQHKRVSACR
jgi:hypothetical protein